MFWGGFGASIVIVTRSNNNGAPDERAEPRAKRAPSEPTNETLIVKRSQGQASEECAEKCQTREEVSECLDD
jgi:hypothetical protein